MRRRDLVDLLALAMLRGALFLRETVTMNMLAGRAVSSLAPRWRQA